ncbi:DUF998 domain-containing protein [Amycolatopsis nivea]
MRNSARLPHPVRNRPAHQGASRPAAIAGRRRQAGWLLLAAGAAYAAWLLEFLLPTGLSPVRSFVSEHYPVFQPYQQLFRAGDLIAGAGYVAAALLLRRVLPPSRAAAVARWSLVVFGVATGADAAFVPDCVSTVDAVCARREFAGAVSWHHLAHLGASAVAQLAVVGVAFALSRLAARSGRPRDRKLVRLLFAVWAVAGAGCLVCYPFGMTGLPQRIQLLVMSAATVAAALRCLRPARARPAGEGAGQRRTRAGTACAVAPDQQARPRPRRRADGARRVPAGRRATRTSRAHRQRAGSG